jgi:hypothetical protein
MVHGADQAIDDAAKNGRLDIVEWLHLKGLNASTGAMDRAATDDHLKVVKFLNENRSEGCTLIAFRSAVRNNHLEVVQFLFEHRRADCTEVSIDPVACKRSIELLKWL